MAENTNIHWCDSTVNPMMGCGGCELFAGPAEVLQAVDTAIEENLGEPAKPNARAIFKELIEEAYDSIPDPSPDHKRQVTTTNIYHFRDPFVERITQDHGGPVAKAARKAIERNVSCYAAKLHLNRALSVASPEREAKNGYAPTFEMLRKFKGRVEKTSTAKDLRGKEDPDRPWISGLPRIIFVSDMGDALCREKDFSFLEREVIEPIKSWAGRRHLWMWLTKRPEIMAKFADRIGGLPDNVCAMTTATGPDTLNLKRIAALRKVNAKLRGLSIEPLLEMIPPAKLNLKGIDWVIVGGESGKKDTVRPFQQEWAEELRDHCAKKGVAFFLKQMGRNPTHLGEQLKLKDNHGGDWSEWEKALRVRKFPEAFRRYRSDEGDPFPGLRRKTKQTLTSVEQKDFKKLNEIVGNAAKSMVKASMAIHEIHERQLYRAEYDTFQDYCESVHKISRDYAYRLMKASRVRAELLPIVNTRGLQMPKNEGQFRELGRVTDPQMREQVLEAAVEVVTNEGGTLTAKVIREVVDERLNGAKPTNAGLTPSKRLEKAREKLQELEELLGQGEDPKNVLAALRRLLKG